MYDISSVTVVNNTSKKVGNDIDSIEHNQNKVKIEFNKSKSSINEIVDLEDSINKELAEQQSIINEMYDKAS